MTTGRWSPSQRRRIDELFLATAGLEASERGPILDAEMPRDEAVLEEVRRRLAEADALESRFLESPLQAFLDSSADAEGDPVAPKAFAEIAATERFEFEEQLGRGGMADVHAAIDRRLNRRVAIKLLRDSDSETEQRFLAEARAQARIQHEHVLDIYEVGLIDECPFLAMRLVEGPTLGELAPTLPLEQKVRLLAQAAEGLHAAHREGLIHHDVKPSNLLVGRGAGGEWRAWVSDFGIAVDSGWTDQASGLRIIGTPHYMAPERIDGHEAADRRSDVWSLGVTLYQLLTGSRPFDGATPLEVLHQVRVGKPTPLRERMPTLPADLVAIVDKCLSLSPDARYPSARALAEDLTRFLDGDVVEAYAAPVAYRLTRFVQRHRRLLTVVGILGAGLLVALVAAAILGIQAMRSQRELAQRQQQAESLVSFMLGDLRKRLEPLGRLDLLAAVGDEAMSYFAAVPQSELTAAELGRRSQALNQIGSVRRLQGDLAGAREAFEQSLQLAHALWRQDPDDYDRLYNLAQCHYWVGYAHWQAGDLDSAGPSFVSYLEDSQRLAELAPQREDAWLEVYYAHSNLGAWHQERGDPERQDLEAALADFERAHEVLTGRLLAEDPGRREWRFELAASHNSLAVIKRSLGRVGEANEHFGAELKLRRELAQAEPGDRSAQEFLATALQYVAAFDLAQGRADVAAPRLDEVNQLLDDLVAYDPDNGEWRYKRIWARMKGSHAAFALGDVDTARRLAHSAVVDAQELVALDGSQVDWRRVLAISLLYVGRSSLGGGFLPSPESLERDVATAEDAAQRAAEILGDLAADLPQDRLTRRWLADSWLLSADLAELRGAGDEARSLRTRAKDALEPWAASSRDPDLLQRWARVLFALGDESATRSVIARLQGLGLPAPEGLPSGP